jgi:CubicO group peptidase (beta-lactamase class C family)
VATGIISQVVKKKEVMAYGQFGRFEKSGHLRPLGYNGYFNDPFLCKPMIRLLFTFVLLICSNSVFAMEVDEKKIDALVCEAMKAWKVPGTALVLVDGEKVLYLKGHGVREQGKNDPVTPDTLFPLASCSKAFTTTLIAMLVEDGTLKWDDPVRKHWPDFKLSDPNVNELVTIRDLLSHRTGVGSHDLLWYRASWSLEEMVHRLRYLPLDKPFRTAMQYQSAMYTAAGLGAARSAKKPWQELIQERIFDPLGMKSSFLETKSIRKYQDRASGHRRLGEKLEILDWYPQEEPNPAGSISSTARDLSKWLQLHLNEGKYQEKQLVSSEELQTIYTSQIVIPMDEGAKQLSPDSVQMSYGLAWVIQDHRGEHLISHAGMIDGFRVHLTLLPKQKWGFAILANVDQSRMNLSLSYRLIDELLKLPPRDWNAYFLDMVDKQAFAQQAAQKRLERTRRLNTQTTLALDQYVGTYENPAYGRLTISFDKEELVLKWSRFQSKLEHWHFDVFRLREDFLTGKMLEYQFTKDKQLTGLRMLGMDFHRVEEKK